MTSSTLAETEVSLPLSSPATVNTICNGTVETERQHVRNLRWKTRIETFNFESPFGIWMLLGVEVSKFYKGSFFNSTGLVKNSLVNHCMVTNLETLPRNGLDH